METSREMLQRLGIPNFSITGLVPYLFMAPAQTDGAMPMIRMLVKAIQNRLNQMGASLPVTGELDAATVIELRKITGRTWPAMWWSDIVKAVLVAQDQGVHLRGGVAPGRVRGPIAVGAIPSPPPLPGGLIGYGVLGAALYYAFTHKKG